MSDSKTKVDIAEIIRFDDRLTVRIDQRTKKLFLAFCEQNGISACQFLHSVLNAALAGVSTERLNVSKSPTINLTIERRVQRVRRYVRESVENDVMEVKQHCAYSDCGGEGSIEMKKMLEGRMSYCSVCSSHAPYQLRNGWLPTS